jgi:hypothetical protein
MHSLEGVKPRVKFRILEMTLTFLPVWVTIVQGQISLVLVLAMLMSWRSVQASDDVQGGLWLALLKPQFVFVPALALAWQRRWRALLGLALGSGVLLLISLLMVGGGRFWQG